MAKSIYENEKYAVVITYDSIGEDGKYGREGYAVVNKETKITELTTTVLPEAIYRADFFNSMLGGTPPVAAVELTETTVIDQSLVN